MDRIEQIVDFISGLDGIQISSLYEDLLAMPALCGLFGVKELIDYEYEDIETEINSMEIEDLLDLYYRLTGFSPSDILESRAIYSSYDE